MQPLKIDGESLNTSMAELPGHVGDRLGPTGWVVMSQEQVNVFADLTGDHNYIHVDPVAAESSPFGGTVAHGFFGLSLVACTGQLLHVSDAATAVNYGLDKVRFPAPLPVGRRWRGVAEIVGVEDVKGGVQVRLASSIEVEGSERPSVVAECLVRFYS
jgi:acyl dehydratase